MRFPRMLRIAAGVATGAVMVVASVAVPLGTGEPPQPSSVATPSPSAVVTPTVTSARPTSAPSPRTAAPSPTPVPETGVDVGQLAPDFRLRTPEGELVALSDFRGQPVWINFWAPWCPACRTEMPRLEGFYLEHRGEGLAILGVGVRDSAESMRAYAMEVGVTYPIVVDGDGGIANTYQALALPVHYWIDRDGVVRDWAFGELPPDLLASSLSTILAGDSGQEP